MIFNIKITFTNLIKVLLINYLRNLNFIIMKLPHVGTSIFPVMTALANKHGAINLAQVFPGFGANNNLLDLVSKHITEGRNQYAPLLGLLSLREKLAEKISDLYGFEYNPSLWVCRGVKGVGRYQQYPDRYELSIFSLRLLNVAQKSL